MRTPSIRLGSLKGSSLILRRDDPHAFQAQGTIRIPPYMYLSLRGTEGDEAVSCFRRDEIRIPPYVYLSQRGIEGDETASCFRRDEVRIPPYMYLSMQGTEGDDTASCFRRDEIHIPPYRFPISSYLIPNHSLTHHPARPVRAAPFLPASLMKHRRRWRCA